MNRKILIVGRGLDPAKHLSLAAIRALRQADIVLGIEPETETWAALREEFQLPPVVDVGEFYRNGAKDMQNYLSFLDMAIEASGRHETVALLVAGHPRLGVTFAQILERKALPAGTAVEVIEGLSSFDVMINDLALDPLEQGTAMIDVNRLLLFQYELEPSINYFFYHVCSVATQAVHYQDASRDNHLHRLQVYLEKFYPSDKKIYLCRASNGAGESGCRIEIELGALAASLSRIDFSTTLFVPADLPRRLDEELLKMIEASA